MINLSDLWVQPRTDADELIDLPGTPWEDVLRGMRDVQRINQVLLTYPILFATFDRLATWPTDRPLRVLDVATGLADIPRALVDFARSHKRQLGVPPFPPAIEVVGLDLNPRILAMAGETLTDYPEISLVQGDALALPFQTGEFDWAFCHLALHHLPLAGHETFFQELARVIRPGGGILVGDLERTRLNEALARPFLQLVTSPIAQHDGIVSIRRALSQDELMALLARTGLSWLGRTWLAPPTQFVVTGIKPES